MVVVCSNALKIIIIDFEIVPKHEFVVACILVEGCTKDLQLKIRCGCLVPQVHNVEVTAPIGSTITPVLSCGDVKIVVLVIHQVEVCISR